MVRIGLISDIHFGKDARCKEYALPGQEINGDVKNAVSLTESAIHILKEKQVEYLFISGDITSLGSPMEFYYCGKKIDEIVKAVGIDKSRVIWCSGNHDNDWGITALGDKYVTKNVELQQLAREKYGMISGAMADMFMGYKNIDEKGVLPSSGIYLDDKIIVFVLNSSSECIRNEEIEHGKLTEDQLKWFKENAEKYKSDTRWKIVLMHHHPFGYTFPYPVLDLSILEEGSHLCDVIGKSGINLVVHGHRHHPICKTTMEADWSNPVSFICGGSFSISDIPRDRGTIPNTFHILELSDEVGLLKLYSYEYCISGGWKPIEIYRDETPLDKVMYLGKVFTEEQTVEAISKLVDITENAEIYDWTDLDDSIRYKSSKALKSAIKKVCELKECKIRFDKDDSMSIKIMRKNV